MRLLLHLLRPMAELDQIPFTVFKWSLSLLWLMNLNFALVPLYVFCTSMTMAGRSVPALIVPSKVFARVLVFPSALSSRVLRVLRYLLNTVMHLVLMVVHRVPLEMGPSAPIPPLVALYRALNRQALVLLHVALTPYPLR